METFLEKKTTVKLSVIELTNKLGLDIPDDALVTAIIDSHEYSKIENKRIEVVFTFTY
jgi:hypothetical protein